MENYYFNLDKYIFGTFWCVISLYYGTRNTNLILQNSNSRKFFATVEAFRFCFWIALEINELIQNLILESIEIAPNKSYLDLSRDYKNNSSPKTDSSSGQI